MKIHVVLSHWVTQVLFLSSFHIQNVFLNSNGKNIKKKKKYILFMSVTVEVQSYNAVNAG